MRKLIGLALILLISTTALAQEPPPQALYSLAYGVANPGEVRVTTYYDDNVWREDTLPARVFFGAMESTLSLPRWSGDGRRLYVSAFEPNVENIATVVQSFDVLSREFSPAVVIIDPESDTLTTEFVSVDAVSPFANYAWTSRLLNLENQLVNLETGRVILSPTPCPARVLAWQPSYVIVACNGLLFSDPNIQVIELATGAVTMQFLPPPQSGDPFARIVKQGRILSGGRILVGPLSGTESGYVGVLSMNTFEAEYFEIGTALRVNQDETLVAYRAGDHLKRLDLQTRVITDVGVTASDPQWDGDTLRFWRTQEHDGLFEIVRIEATPHHRVEHILYSGIKPTNWLFAPQGSIFALEFQRGPTEQYVEIYDESGLLWVSDFNYPNALVTLPLPNRVPIAWSGDWLHLNFTSPETLQQRTLSVNLDTLETVIAPLERAVYMGSSPDGLWWLYATNNEPTQEIKDRLFVYRRDTGEQFDIVPGEPLYDNFQYPQWMYFSWSPPIPRPNVESGNGSDTPPQEQGG